MIITATAVAFTVWWVSKVKRILGPKVLVIALIILVIAIPIIWWIYRPLL
jgi:hypothetical protein